LFPRVAQIAFPGAVLGPLLHDECDEHSDCDNQDFPQDFAPPVRRAGELRKSQWPEHPVMRIDRTARRASGDASRSMKWPELETKLNANGDRRIATATSFIDFGPAAPRLRPL
jgi:hypothetical protein